jgi:adenylosuccinate synthase
MANTAVIGSSWGDEGKGKIVDYLCAKSDVIVRYQGGNNAGHTIVANGEQHIFHLLPSGILHPNKLNIIANGLVVDLGVLKQELQALKDKKHGRLALSDAATITMPWHKAFDGITGKEVGTTGRGIGPAYCSKYSRQGFRVGELLDFPKFETKLRAGLKAANWLLRNRYKKKPFCLTKIKAEFRAHAGFMKPFILNSTLLISDCLAKKKTLLLEGAQGTLLDIDHGTYPYVTSSNPTIGGIYTGTGVRIQNLRVVGLVKAYQTRVGNGAMPTELLDSTGERLRELGREFGATTGRPRRCGWLDLVLLRYAHIVNGFDALALTKLDVLSGFDTLRVCIGYRHKGKVHRLPPGLSQLSLMEPVYKELSGWRADIGDCRSFLDLPKQAQAYVKFIERGVGSPVKYIGVGPGREELICR